MPNGSPWPRISVVTPSYNQAQFIEETIRSVLLQGYPNLEYIIIDGGSTDGSVDIIRKYEPWLSYWVSEKDRGQSDAINKGWRRSRGEIVAWLNSDDVYSPGALAEAVEFLQAHPETALVYSDYRVIDERSEVTESVRVSEYDPRSELRRNLIPQPTTFMRRQVLEAVGMLDEELHFVMDYDLWLRISALHEIKRASGMWASFRVCSGTKTVSQAEAFCGETLRVVRQQLSDRKFASRIGLTLSEVQGRVHLNTALSCYGVGQVRIARRHFLQAIRLSPGLITESPVLALLVRSLLGDRIVGAVRRQRRRALT